MKSNYSWLSLQLKKSKAAHAFQLSQNLHIIDNLLIFLPLLGLHVLQIVFDKTWKDSKKYHDQYITVLIVNFFFNLLRYFVVKRWPGLVTGSVVLQWFMCCVWLVTLGSSVCLDKQQTHKDMTALLLQ